MPGRRYPDYDYAAEIAKSITNISTTSTRYETNIEENNISPEFTNMLCCVFDNAIDQFHILGCIGKIDPNIIKTNFRKLKDRVHEYYHEDPIFDVETAEPFEVSFEKKKLRKIQDDGTFITEILIHLKDQLKESNSFKSIMNLTNVIYRKKAEENCLISEVNRNSGLEYSLKRMLQSEHKDSQNKIQSVMEQIAHLKDKIENIYFENMLRVRYSNHWEKARLEQNFLTCNRKEEELLNTINTYKTKIEKEIRINSEIEMYILENQKDMEESIDKWINMYTEESEKRQTEIQLLNEQREEQENTFNALKNKYESHKKELEEYLQYKEKKRIEEERLALLNALATKIQAWWRGMLVRHKLGPYNPKKGKKGKGKNKDKNKKSAKKKK